MYEREKRDRESYVHIIYPTSPLLAFLFFFFSSCELNVGVKFPTSVKLKLHLTFQALEARESI